LYTHRKREYETSYQLRCYTTPHEQTKMSILISSDGTVGKVKNLYELDWLPSFELSVIVRV
jgi:hypothetical protein